MPIAKLNQPKANPLRSSLHQVGDKRPLRRFGQRVEHSINKEEGPAIGGAGGPTEGQIQGRV